MAAGTRLNWTGFLILGWMLGSLAMGCGMFDIRAPVAPGTGPEVGPPRASPVAPESVLFNFTHAIRYQLNGLQQLGSSLAETFHLVLDEGDVGEINIPGIDSLEKARTVKAQELRSQESSADSFYFAFDESEAQKIEEGSTAYYLDIPYELRILVRQGDSLVVSQTISGKSDLYLAELLGGQWAITRWVDQRQPPNTSLGRWFAEIVGTSQAPGAP